MFTPPTSLQTVSVLLHPAGGVSATRSAKRMLTARVTMSVRVVSRMAMSPRRHSGIRGQKSLVVSVVGRREGVNENGAASAGDGLGRAPGMGMGKRRERGDGAGAEDGEAYVYS